MTMIHGLLNEDEWELLCDNCGLCCLYKIQDEDTNEVLYTSVLCQFLNKESHRCLCYPERFQKMPTCTKISEETLPQIARWLPKSCAYRCLYEGIALPEWHPLRTAADQNSKALLQKIEKICVRPNTCISQNTADRIIRKSLIPKSTHKLTRLLIANVIEDIDI